MRRLVSPRVRSSRRLRDSWRRRVAQRGDHRRHARPARRARAARPGAGGEAARRPQARRSSCGSPTSTRTAPPSATTSSTTASTPARSTCATTSAARTAARDRPAAARGQVDPVLPPGQVEPNQLEIDAGPRARRLPAAADRRRSSLWVLGLLAIVARSSAAAGGQPARRASTGRCRWPTGCGRWSRGPSPGKLSQPELAELERTLLAFWRKRLGLEAAEPAEAMAALREARGGRAAAAQLGGVAPPAGRRRAGGRGGAAAARTATCRRTRPTCRRGTRKAVAR